VMRAAKGNGPSPFQWNIVGVGSDDGNTTATTIIMSEHKIISTITLPSASGFSIILTTNNFRHNDVW